MATIRICDRCGTEIFPIESTVPVIISRTDNAVAPYTSRYELCPTCANILRKWFNQKVEFENEEAYD